jgi:hypothetical protein
MVPPSPRPRPPSRRATPTHLHEARHDRGHHRGTSCHGSMRGSDPTWETGDRSPPATATPTCHLPPKNRWRTISETSITYFVTVAGALRLRAARFQTIWRDRARDRSPRWQRRLSIVAQRASLRTCRCGRHGSLSDRGVLPVCAGVDRIRGEPLARWPGSELAETASAEARPAARNISQCRYIVHTIKFGEIN